MELTEISQNTEVLELSTEVSVLENRAASLAVADEASLNQANSWLVDIKRLKDAVEAKRTFFTKPLNDHLRTINAFFKTFSEPLVRADAILRDSVLKYRREQDAIRREEEARLRAEAEERQREAIKQAQESGVPIPPPTPLPVIPQQQSKTMDVGDGKVIAKKAWTFRIVHAGEVPREYLSIDEKKIRAVIKAGIRNIPGVEIYEEESLAVGGQS